MSFALDWSHNHLLNPLWQPHARFHGAVLLFLFAGVATTALWLIWRRHMGMMHYYHKHHPGPWYWTVLTDAGILLRCAHQFVINPLRALTKGRPIK